ncbi:MAG: glycosyltransferase [archaeon]|nr:glycosyltransferase [archaeon]
MNKYLIFHFFIILLFLLEIGKINSKDKKQNETKITVEEKERPDYEKIYETFNKYINFEEQILDSDFNFDFKSAFSDVNEELGKEYKDPQISIIIPCNGYISTIFPLLYSIEKQEYKNLEIIIFDYRNDTLLSDKITELTKIDPRIKYIKDKEIDDALLAKEYAAKAAKGEFLLFVEPEDIFISNKLLTNVNNKIQTEDYDIIQFNTLNFVQSKLEFQYGPILAESITDSELRDSLKEKKVMSGGIQKNIYLYNKLFKRQTFLKALESIPDKYYEDTNRGLSDFIILFTLFTRFPQSVSTISTIGYLHIFNKNDEKMEKANALLYTDIRMKKEKNKLIKSYLTYIDFLLDNYINSPEGMDILNKAIEDFFSEEEFANIDLKSVNKRADKVIEKIKGNNKLMEENKRYISSYINNKEDYRKAKEEGRQQPKKKSKSKKKKSKKKKSDL